MTALLHTHLLHTHNHTITSSPVAVVTERSHDGGANLPILVLRHPRVERHGKLAKGARKETPDLDVPAHLAVGPLNGTHTHTHTHMYVSGDKDKPPLLCTQHKYKQN